MDQTLEAPVFVHVVRTILQVHVVGPALLVLSTLWMDLLRGFVDTIPAIRVISIIWPQMAPVLESVRVIREAWNAVSDSFLLIGVIPQVIVASTILIVVLVVTICRLRMLSTFPQVD